MAVWCVMAVIASAAAPVPSWITDLWAEDRPALEAALGAVGSTSPAELNGSYDPAPVDRLDIDAHASVEEITIRLSGTGWAKASNKGRWLLQQNLAHELVHTVQLKKLSIHAEPRWLHEGYAEARAIDILETSGLWSPEEVRAWHDLNDQRCITVLEKGALEKSLAAGDRHADYACGAIIVDAIAALAGRPLVAVHDDYAAQRAKGRPLLSILRDLVDRDTARQVIIFVTQDYSHGAARYAIDGLRAGRL